MAENSHGEGTGRGVTLWGRIAQFLLRIAPVSALFAVEHQIYVNVTLIQTGGAGAENNSNTIATKSGDSVVHLWLDLHQCCQQ